MSPHSDRPIALTSLAKVAAWVGARWQVHRARRQEEETVACLGAMDTKLRDDIGAQISQFDELSSTDRRRPS